MAGKRMLSISVILFIGSLLCVLLGYLIYQIWIDRKRRSSIGVEMSINRNASRRRRRSKKKKKRSSSKSKRRKSSRLKKRKKSGRRKKKSKTITARKSKSKRTSPNPQASDEHEQLPLDIMKSVAQPLKRIDMKIDHPEKSPKEILFHQLDEKQLNKGFVAIARDRSQSTRMNNKNFQCLCIKCNDPYSSLFQAVHNVDYIKDVLPCDASDTTTLSKYQYELNYDEEHVFRC